ncbi:MAG: 5-formyltetrahydrofolate cyclo-ligase [Acutalibacteraceae bacterium]
MADKKELRKQYRHLRSMIAQREMRSAQICQNLIAAEEFRKTSAVLSYMSIGSEADVRAASVQALADGKVLALPKCLDREGNMSFYAVKSLSQTSRGMYDIAEPMLTDFPFLPDSNSICLVPGLSFDLLGNRLGYGKGYYDRFLRDFPGIKVGIAFAACICDCLPAQDKDMQVDYLVTEDKIYQFTL